MALILTTRSLDTPMPMPQQLRVNTETEVMSPCESVTGKSVMFETQRYVGRNHRYGGLREH